MFSTFAFFSLAIMKMVFKCLSNFWYYFDHFVPMIVVGLAVVSISISVVVVVAALMLLFVLMLIF